MYLEYYELLRKFKEAEKQYLDALDKKTKLLYLVTPHGTEVKPIVNHLSNMSPDEAFNKYTREIQEVDLLINSARNNKDAHEYEMKKKEKELRESKDIYDKIFVHCWLNHKKPSQIYRLVGCSRSSAYNYKDEIKANLQKIKEKYEKK